MVFFRVLHGVLIALSGTTWSSVGSKSLFHTHSRLYPQCIISVLHTCQIDTTALYSVDVSTLKSLTSSRT